MLLVLNVSSFQYSSPGKGTLVEADWNNGVAIVQKNTTMIRDRMEMLGRFRFIALDNNLLHPFYNKVQLMKQMIDFDLIELACAC